MNDVRCGMYWALWCTLAGCGGEKDSSAPTEDNTAPEAFITSHADGAAVFDRQQLNMTGMVSDTEDDATDLLVVWSQGSTVVCPEQAPASDGTTSCNITIDYTGSPEVSLVVKDTSGRSTLTKVTFDIIDSEPPAVDILEPVPGGLYSASEPIRFLVEVTDPDNEPGQLTVVWDSNIQGELVLPSPDPSGLVDGMVSLEEGDHRITVEVSDPDGNVADETLFLAVGP